jgi:cell shape-determining protein MreC
MNSRMPDQDNIQERLKTLQEECRRLREENADLRAMLGINQSPPKEPVP